MGNSSKRDKRAIERAEKAALALGLRRGGASYAQIAQQLGFANKSVAFKLVQQAIKDIPKEDAPEVFALDLERIDALLRTHTPRQGEPRSAAVVIRCLERRASMYGYDAPTKIDMNLAERELEEALDVLEKELSPDEFAKVASILARKARGQAT